MATADGDGSAAPLSLNVDGKKVADYPWRICRPGNCVVPGDQAGLEALRKGEAASFSITPFGGEAITLPMSPKGVSSALTALAKK